MRLTRSFSGHYDDEFVSPLIGDGLHTKVLLRIGRTAGSKVQGMSLVRSRTPLRAMVLIMKSSFFHAFCGPRSSREFAVESAREHKTYARPRNFRAEHMLHRVLLHNTRLKGPLENRSMLVLHRILH